MINTANAGLLLILIPSGAGIICLSLYKYIPCDVDPVLCKTHQEGIKDYFAQEKIIRFMQALKMEIYIVKCHMPFCKGSGFSKKYDIIIVL